MANKTFHFTLTGHITLKNADEQDDVVAEQLLVEVLACRHSLVADFEVLTVHTEVAYPGEDEEEE